MNRGGEQMEASVNNYCAAIGADPLLVQGAGGNVSWKDGDTLWVKASGTWLANAVQQAIFVPVDLAHLRGAVADGDFSVTPRPLGESALRPSIETLLHALMPHRVVLHLHAVEIAAHLVRRNCESDFSVLGPEIRWALVEYRKPGAPLAAAVNAVLAGSPQIDVIFLQNHGVVIGGADLARIDHLLRALTSALQIAPAPDQTASMTPLAVLPETPGEYAPIPDSQVQKLALDPALFDRLGASWALFPDHVVFLGARPFTYTGVEDFQQDRERALDAPELVFILGCGVFARPGFSQAKYLQLRCYSEVMLRQGAQDQIAVLAESDIAELLDWDAERYRLSLSR
jgi:rhamnose utilization protein RhaD (predicted bifunctional aldolase and dehydrogenase)